MIHQWDGTQQSGDRVLLWHCFTAVCRAKTDNGSLNGSRKEVDRPLCLKGTRNSAAYEASLRRWGAEASLGGALICGASRHTSQVAELLDQCTMRTTWTVRGGGWWEQRGEVWPVCYGNSFSDTVTCYPHPTDFWIYPQMILRHCTRQIIIQKEEFNTHISSILLQQWCRNES